MARVGTNRRPSRAGRRQLKFEHRLVLANWMLDLFGVATFRDLAKNMRDPAFEGFNEDLEEFFQKQQYNTLDMEFDLVYVNGDNNLMNIPVVPEEEGAEPRYKVRLIEEEFKRLMFDVKDV